MITFGDKRFVVVSPDNTAQVFSPVKGRGGAHAVTLATPERPGVDVLGFGDKITAVCGSKLTAANLTPGATRAMCVKCDAWLKSDAHGNEVERVLNFGTDTPEVSDWAIKSVRWAVSVGIINGVGDGTLSPKTSATRAQVATMLMRYDAMDR